MKSSKLIVNLSVIFLSFAILASTLWLGYNASSDTAKTNLFSADSVPGAEIIQTTINYETYLSEGDALFAGGYFSLAGSKYALAIKNQPENPIAYNKLGLVYLQSFDAQKALENFKLAMDLNSKDLTYAVNYGRALLALKEFNKAFEHFQALNSESQEVLFYRSLISSYRGDFESARAEIQESARFAGNINTTYLQAVNSAFQNFDVQQKGRTIFLEALLTKAMIDSEEYYLAEAMALKVLERQSDYRDVWTLLGYAQMKIKKYQDAKQAFDQALKVDSTKSEIHYFMGMTNYLLEDYENAVKSFETALLYGFENENEIYRKIAESQLFREKYEDALDAYEYVLKIDQTSIQDYIKAIALAVNMLKDLDRALSLAQESTTYFPREAMSHTMLSWVYIEKNEMSLAKQSINLALQIDSSLPEANYNYGRILEREENFTDALKAYKKAYELSELNGETNQMAYEAYERVLIKDVQ